MDEADRNELIENYANPVLTPLLATLQRVTLPNLTQVQDLATLDGRSLHLTSDFGRVVVIVPPGLGATVDAHVHGGGNVDLFGFSSDGFGVHEHRQHSGGVGAPALTIEADVKFGEIKIYQEGTP